MAWLNLAGILKAWWSSRYAHDKARDISSSNAETRGDEQKPRFLGDAHLPTIFVTLSGALADYDSGSAFAWETAPIYGETVTSLLRREGCKSPREVRFE